MSHAKGARWLLALLFLLVPHHAPTYAQDMISAPDRHLVVTFPNPFQPGLGSPGSTWKGYSWAGGYRVAGNVARDAREFAADHNLSIVESWPIALLDMYCVVFAIEQSADRNALIASLATDTRVSLVQPLQEFSTSVAPEQATSNDPYTGLQRSHELLNLAPLRDVASGDGVRIAVVDTGAQLTHPDLAKQIFAHDDFVGREGDQFNDDIHGTAVAGIIAATAGNRRGVEGVAPNARLAILKACWPVREGAPSARCNSFTLARAIARAVELRVGLINLSVSGPEDPLLSALLKRVLARDIVVVGSATSLSAERSFPADVAGVIAVHDVKTPTARNTLPAPGTDVVTTIPTNEYEFVSGHSFAAANVSGVVSLMLELNPKLSPASLSTLLFTAVTRTDKTTDLLDACLAAASLTNQVHC